MATSFFFVANIEGTFRTFSYNKVVNSEDFLGYLSVFMVESQRVNELFSSGTTKYFKNALNIGSSKINEFKTLEEAIEFGMKWGHLHFLIWEDGKWRLGTSNSFFIEDMIYSY
jgi:hypothetical protein